MPFFWLEKDRLHDSNLLLQMPKDVFMEMKEEKGIDFFSFLQYD